MKIAITGALGHIGSKLLRTLPDTFPSAELVLIDNFLTQRYCSLFNLPANANYTFIENDILNANLDQLLAGVDAVVHLAAITEAAGSFDQVERTEEVNFVGTERVAKACAANSIPLVFLSTTSVYTPARAVIDEECGPEELRPASPYALSKLRGEFMLQELGRTEKLHFVTLRFGTIVGTSPGMRFHTAVNKFVWQACAGRPISVWRTALDQKRPYLDLNDAVRAIAAILERERFDRSIYNVLTANATVRQVTDLIRLEVPDLTLELVDSKAMNDLSYEVSRKRFDNLNFRFTPSLAPSISETIALLKNMRRSPVLPILT